MTSDNERIYILDAVRGTAIIAMIFHHAYVLLNSFDLLYLSFFHSKAFEVVQLIFVSLFLLVSGICTNFSKSTLRRGVVILAAATCVTAVTAGYMPLFGFTGFEIYFGILHMFGLTMLIYSLIQPILKKVNGSVIGIVSLLLFFFFYFYMQVHPYALESNAILTILGFPSVYFFSADYYPLLPYIFIFIFGAMLGRAVKNRKLPNWFYSFRCVPLEFVGRHSLMFYLLHQPIIMGIIFMVSGF